MAEAAPITGWRQIIGVIAIALATFAIVLDYSIANVSIPYISGDLAVSVDQGTYVITAFAVGSAIVLPISGWLTKRLGIIRLMTFSILGFTFFSWVCGMSGSITTLVLSRFLQGIASGPMIPLSQTLIVLISPPNKKEVAMAFWSTIVIVAPIVGPILGGWISYDYAWPWIFFINIPLGIFSALVIKIILKPLESKAESNPVDYIGLILLALSVTCFQILLDKGEQFDWLRSDLIRALAVTSFVSFAFLIPWEFFHKYPLLDLRLFKIRTYSLSVLFIAVMYSIYFGAVVLVPLWLQQNMGYTALWAGITVAPLGVMPVLFTGIIPKIVQKTGETFPLFIAFAFFAISSFDGAMMNSHADIKTIAASRFLLGFGILFFIVPVFTLQIRDVPKEKLAAAAGIFHFVKTMLGGVGTSVFTTMWERRSSVHHSNLVSEVREQNVIIETLHQLGVEGQKAWEILNLEINNQAAVLGLNDCFYFMGWCFIILIPFLLLARKKREVLQ